jgi:hypothetical protein
MRLLNPVKPSAFTTASVVKDDGFSRGPFKKYKRISNLIVGTRLAKRLPGIV